MQSIKINTTPKWLEMKFEFIRNKFHIQIKVDEEEPTVHEVEEPVVVIEEEPVVVIEEEPVVVIEDSAEEKKRCKSEYRKRYYEANKEKFREYSRRRTQAKKALKQPVLQDDIQDNLSEVSDDSLVFDYDPSLILHNNAETIEKRHNYYQNHLTEIRKYYQDNKERIAKKYQTDEAKAKFREQYHARRSSLTPEQIAAKNKIATAQRKVREFKLKAKYPNCKTLKAAKALKAAEDKARREGM